MAAPPTTLTSTSPVPRCFITRSVSLAAQTYPGTPAVSGQNYGWSSWNDSIYRRISIAFVASSASTAVRFYDSGLQDLSDESWGIDNVGVRQQDIGAPA